MKIFHTETQADYDALMMGLEVKGIETLAKEYWELNRHETAVFVHAIGPYGDSSRTDTTYGSLGWAIKNHPRVPIIKYKAKADTSVKFTKENVGKLFNEHDKYICFSINDLRDEILKLDDTPEKVAVPKYVAEWIEWNKEIGVSLQIMLMCYKGFYENTDPIVADSEKAVQWYVDNPYKFIQAYEKGYTVESDTATEQRYTVVIADRYLVQLFIGRTDYRFVEFDELCAWKPSAFQLTEAEIKAIDERYWTFAGPVKEVAE